MIMYRNRCFDLIMVRSDLIVGDSMWQCVKDMVIVPVFPQPLLITNYLQTSGAKSGANFKKTPFFGVFFFLCSAKKEQTRFTASLHSNKPKN